MNVYFLANLVSNFLQSCVVSEMRLIVNDANK